jgi:hypothetical protein
VRAQTGADGPERVLALAAHGLPTDRRDWGRAMLAELGGVHGVRARWSFSLGCSRAALALRTRARLTAPDRGGRGVRGAVLAAIAATLVLAAYGLVHYPGLRTGFSTWASLTAFLVLMLGYASAALTLSRGTTAQACSVRRRGLAGGLIVGGAWLVILAPGEVAKGFVIVPLAVALLVPAGVAVLAGRSTRDARAATAAAFWSGLVGGLLVFVVWVTATYARDGRPYDAQMLRDFHKSGSRDLVAYAVSDNLGAALGLLVIIPVVALALGSLSGRLAAG